MRKIVTVGGMVTLAAAIVIGSVTSTGAVVVPRAKLTLLTKRGPNISVGPGEVTGLNAYNVRCPSGYAATGYGVLNGATDVVYADPSLNGRGYEFSFGNSSSTMPFRASASVRCVSASRATLVVRFSQAEKARAIHEARMALRSR